MFTYFFNKLLSFIQRSDLLKKLASVQLPETELKKLTSITSVQTRGAKNFLKNTDVLRRVRDDVSEDTEQKHWSSIAGKKRKERLALLNGYVDYWNLK